MTLDALHKIACVGVSLKLILAVKLFSKYIITCVITVPERHRRTDILWLCVSSRGKNKCNDGRWQISWRWLRSCTRYWTSNLTSRSMPWLLTLSFNSCVKQSVVLLTDLQRTYSRIRLHRFCPISSNPLSPKPNSLNPDPNPIHNPIPNPKHTVTLKLTVNISLGEMGGHQASSRFYCELNNKNMSLGPQ